MQPLQVLGNQYNQDSQKGLSAILENQHGKITILKSQLSNKEAEIERLNLQISELSSKINSEPEKNMIENLLQNA